MTHILMSIQTDKARKIFDGDKVWEFRKSLPRNLSVPSQKVIVYSSRCDMAIIGEFTVGRVVQTAFDELMAITGCDKNPKHVEWMRAYYKGSRVCSAIKINHPRLYTSPIPLQDIKQVVPKFRPPQNFIYLRPGDPLYSMIEDDTRMDTLFFN